MVVTWACTSQRGAPAPLSTSPAAGFTVVTSRKIGPHFGEPLQSHVVVGNASPTSGTPAAEGLRQSIRSATIGTQGC